MRITRRPQRTTLAIFISAIGTSGLTLAAPLTFVQYPAGTAYKAPIPNVILSIDTSGSMSFCDVNGAVIGSSTWNTVVNGCYQPTSNINLRRITYVKNGLKTLLVDSAKYDGQFRLAWQSFACNGIPSSNGNCGGVNAMAKFTGTHRTNFGTWLNGLTATGSTPSPVLAWNAGKYLETTDADSPWNATPGIKDDKPLACRRAYHIFLTDGGWNYKFNDGGLTDTSFKNDMLLGTKTNTKNTAPSDPANTVVVSNYDGKPIATLPTPAPASATHPASPYGTKSYSITDAETKIYRDNFGTRIVNTSSGSNSNYTFTYYAYPTLSDIAFYFWSKDLQPNINNEVIPKVRKTGAETFTSNSKTVTLSEYWNPKNDPAEWQHLTQYTIGYGTSAGNLPKVNSTSPQWSGGTFDMYGAGFSSLAAGDTYWDDVTSAATDQNNTTTGYDAVRPQEM